MNTTFDPYARNVARETLHGHLGPYARNRVREILHGHRGLLDSIEPEDETLPCGALGVPPPAEDDRHTALGDAAWALAIYDHITGGEEKL